MNTKSQLTRFGCLATFLLVLSALFSPLSACHLPIDPDIAVIIERDGVLAEDYDEPGKVFVVQEDQEVTWRTFWNASEFANDPLYLLIIEEVLGPPHHVFAGYSLYDVSEYYEIVGDGKMKVHEIWNRALNREWRQAPHAPNEAGGEVFDSEWTLHWRGGASRFISRPENPRDLEFAFIDWDPISGNLPGTPPTSGTWQIADDHGWQNRAGTWYLATDRMRTTLYLDQDPQVWNGDMPSEVHEIEASVTYPTPTGNRARIHVGGFLATSFDYRPGSSEYVWREVFIDTDGNEVPTATREFGISWTGTVDRTSIEQFGELAEAWVRVEDTTPPQHFRATQPTVQGTVGKALDGTLTFEVLDNDPFVQEDNLPTPQAHLWYSTMLCDWHHLEGDRPLCDAHGGGQAHNHHDTPACDCQAYHSERWVWKTQPLDHQGFRQVLVDGQPAYGVHTFTVNASELDALPWHYAEGAIDHDHTGFNVSESYTDYQPDRLKFFITCTDSAGNTVGPQFSWLVDGCEHHSARDRAVELDPNGYVRIDSFDGVEHQDQLKPPADVLLSQIGAAGEEWGRWGRFGTMEVDNDAMPDIRVYVTDTRYNQTHVFGHDGAGDGGIEPYRQARQAGPGGSASSDSNTEDSPYLDGDDAPETWHFNLEMDYSDQLDMIGTQAYAPAKDIDEGNPFGFWTDEDTRLVFRVVCRDNINRWRETLDDYTIQIVDGPRGVNTDLTGRQDSQGNYEYIFRDPNRGERAIEEPCQLVVRVSNDRGQSREMIIDFFVASNELRMQTLEEQRRRIGW